LEAWGRIMDYLLIEKYIAELKNPKKNSELKDPFES
jgi:hypothetical protein